MSSYRLPDNVYTLKDVHTAFQQLKLILDQFSPVVAAVPPAVTDDASKGYDVGKVWVDEASSIAYRLTDNTIGAAVWQQIIGTNATIGQGGQVAGGGELDGSTDHLGVWNFATGLIKRVLLNDLATVIGLVNISDDAYGAGWNSVVDVAPSKNAVYDKIETLATQEFAIAMATAL